MRFAAWAPGLESHRDWQTWARDPRPPPKSGAPDVRFLPALMRRRCDQLSRMMLHVARGCCDASLLGDVTCVFASRHGAFATMVSMLEDLAVDAPLSPASFSHSVHNTQAGLFSIWAKNPQPSTSLAAGPETFEHGFLESLAMLHREPGRPLLYVMGEGAIPEPVEVLSDHLQGAYALALLLTTADSSQPELELELEASRGAASHFEHPDALEFLRFWLSEEDTLRITHPPRTWLWRRV
jgi:hypothetical protein